MTGITPAIAVSLPARSVSEARRQMEQAQAAGADLAELRVDRLEAFELNRVGELFPSRLPLIATLRSRVEGGEGPDDPEARARILLALARHPFRWIDVESDRDLAVADALIGPGQRGLIVSSHRPTGVTETAWRRLVREPVPVGSVRKVVVHATVGQSLRELVPALPPPGESPLIALTTGPSGPLLRVWSRRFGFPIVFAALPDTEEGPTASVEPSQLPIDRMRPYLRAEGNPPLFAVAGHPVAHSRSPALHSRWMAEHHRVGLYVALDFETDQEFVDSIPALVDGGFRGINVTHPFKKVAFELAANVAPGAAACGVANTLSFGAEGVEADNTDLAAILRRLEELRSVGRWEARSVGVVGSGGAARATLAAARTLGVRAQLWARRTELADALGRELGGDSVQDLARDPPELVVNATTVGRGPDGSGLPAEVRPWFRKGIHVLDWVYAPEFPAVRDLAVASGATYEDGSRLLVYQASASYGLWWGEEPTAQQQSTALEAVR